MDFDRGYRPIGGRRGFTRAGDRLVTDARPWEAALRWMQQRPGTVATWAVNDNRVLPKPLDDGASELKAYLRSRTGDPHAVAEALAHLFDHAHTHDHAVWCWQEGDTDYIRVEPRPVWAVAN